MMDLRRILGFLAAGLGLWLWIGAGSGLVGMLLTAVGLVVAFTPEGGYISAATTSGMTVIAAILVIVGVFVFILGGPGGWILGGAMVVGGVWLAKQRRVFA